MPEGSGKFPVVLERGYDPGRVDIGHHEVFPQAGFVYVGQRARGNLEGGMFFFDAEDGYDCIEWVSQQKWCDGDIVMYGRSFMGATQLLVAPEQHPNLKAIVPQNISDEPWERQYRDHGALQLAHTARRIYRTKVADDQSDAIERFGGWDKFYRHLPLITLDEAVIGRPNRLWKEYVSHSTYDDYWRAISIRDKYHKIKIPTYVMGGWYDNYPYAAFRTYQRLRETGANDEIRIVINPSNHSNKVVGDRDFGPNAQNDEFGRAIRWFNYLLKGIDTGITDEPPISIFVMGINEWRGEYEWPLARTQVTRYYLHSDGSRRGSLNTAPPGDEPPITYTYDPEDPVPTLGGNHSSPEDNPHIIRVGAVDQRPNESRADVLVFTTEPMQADLEVTGPVEVILYAASSAKDTDFVARLIDVSPDGTAYNLTEGIIRGRFRESIWDPPKLLTPGAIEEFRIDLQPTSNVFRRGHCIRLHVTSSGFPLWDRNPNTGHKQGMDADIQVAHQTIYHDAERPSHVVLPVIPAIG